MSEATIIQNSPGPRLRDEYIRIRRQCFFLRYPLLPPTFGLVDANDYLGEIVVAFADGRVVGGARLNWSTPEAARELPLETSAFRLPAVAGDLCGAPYGEISRYAVSPEFSGEGELSLEIARAMCARAAARGIDTLFSMCPPPVARLNRRHAASLGVGFVPFPGHWVPNPFGLAMVLCAYTNINRHL